MEPIFAYDISPEGKASAVPQADLHARAPQDGYRWIHLDLSETGTEAWLERELPEVVADALTHPETRPRCDVVPEGILFNLRAINLNPGADPFDMVSLRGFIGERLVVTTRRRRVFALADLAETLARGKGPENEGELVADLADRIVWRIEEVVTDLEDQTDEMEENILGGEGEGESEAAETLGRLRREVIRVRRYAGPEREALARLATLQARLGPDTATRIAEVANRMTRAVEELDSLRDRLAAAMDHLFTLHSARQNRNLYLLSVIAGIFVPLSFLTGLFGVNLGGIPGAHWPWAFAAFCALLVVIGVLAWWLVRRSKWL